MFMSLINFAKLFGISLAVSPVFILPSSISMAQEKQKILFQARLMDNGPVIENGIEWKIYAPQQDGNGDLEELLSSNGGPKAFEMAPGEYYVQAAYGQVGAVRRIIVGAEPKKENFIFNAGGLHLKALASPNGLIPDRLLRFDIYEETLGPNGSRKLLTKDVKPEEVIAFPTGTYHVVSRFGNLNATVRADLRVQLGKLTKATLQHRAAIVTFRLVRQAGGDAVADTAWSILTETGEVIHESTSTFPSMVLAEGAYTAIAKHDDAVYSQDFEVLSGFNTDIDVLVPN